MHLVCLDCKFLGVKAFGGCRVEFEGGDAGMKRHAKNKTKIHPTKAELEDRVERPDTARQSCLGKRLFLLIWQLLAWEEKCSFLKLFTWAPPTRKVSRTVDSSPAESSQSGDLAHQYSQIEL